MADRKRNPLGNQLRAELYMKLFPEIIREDHRRGVDGFVRFWDDPLGRWDDGGFWDEMGVTPVLKNIFYAIEREEEIDLEEIDKLTELVDPDKCPAEFLDIMARSLGHPLEEDLTEQGQREAIKSIIQLNKSRGKELSWDVFFRMIGFTVRGVPLWKKSVHESQDRYAREQYVTNSISNEVIGTAGLTDYSGTLLNRPLKPGSIVIKTSGKTYRDNDNKISENFGNLVAADGSEGSFNYARGKYKLKFSSPTTTDLTVSYEHITDAFPYRAARVDLEVFFSISEEAAVGQQFDNELLDKILDRLEEVRPIHVLVRLVILVLDSPDVLEDFASDEVECGPDMGKDVRTDEYRLYAADLAEVGKDDGLFAIKQGAGTDTSYLVDEHLKMGINPDSLEILFSDGSPPQYW